MHNLLHGVVGSALLLTIGPAGADSIAVQVNGEPVRFPNAQPTQIAGRVMIPLRGVLERLGADRIAWEPANQRVSVSSPAGDIRLHIGDRVATVDGRSVPLDVPPLIVNNTTMVPLRFVSENLGARVDWLPASQTVYIATASERVAGSRERIPDRQDRLDRRSDGARGADRDRSNPVRDTATGTDRGRDTNLPDRRERPVPRRDTAVEENGERSPYLSDLLPRQGAQARDPRPEIFARFRPNAKIDYNSVQLSLNGRDVTRDAEITDAGVRFQPADDLRRGRNNVRLTFKDTRGVQITQAWYFTVP